MFGSIKGLFDVKKIANGGIGKLSISQIVTGLVNLVEAKRNLSPNDYRQVLNLFMHYKSLTKKIDMDYYLYMENCEEIIKSFDGIAPFERYSGRNSDDNEFMEFLYEIRDKVEYERCKDKNYALVKEALEVNKNIYWDTYIRETNGISTKEEYNNALEKCIYGYNSTLCKYVLEHLNNELKTKFILVMKNPFNTNIEEFKNYDASYFDTFGFSAGQILLILYFINDLEINEEYCFVLSKKEKTIMNYRF